MVIYVIDNMAIEMFGLSGLSLYAVVIGLVLLFRYMGWITMLPVSKKTAGIGAVALIAYGLISGGVIAMPGAAVDEAEEPAAMQYLDVTYEDSATHVTDGEPDYVKVEYKENTADGDIYFADDAATSDMDSVQFDIALHRIDTMTDNDIVFGMRADQIVVENSDADESPFDVFDTTDDDKVDVKITPSGGTGTYEYNNTVVSAAGDKTVTITASVLDTALTNVETYDSIRESSFLTIKGPNGSTQHTLEIEFLKVGEVS